MYRSGSGSVARRRVIAPGGSGGLGEFARQRRLGGCFSAAMSARRGARRGGGLLVDAAGCGSGGGGRARIRASARMKSSCQAQRAGRCSIHWRALRVSLPGTCTSRRRMVRATRMVSFGLPTRVVQRTRSWGQYGDHCPCAVGVELARLEVNERLVA